MSIKFFVSRGLVVLFVFMFFGIWSSPVKVHAVSDASASYVENQSACSNLDVVFVVDQSDSMSLGGVGSDPLEGRKHSIAAMIELLADLAVDQCADSIYRVAVVSFGNKDKARVDVPLSNIAPNSIEDAQAIRTKLIAMLKADQLGQTYPIDGLEQVAKIFYEASTFGDAPRKKVIIFLTDGIPCTETNLACLGTGDPAGAVREVVDYFNSVFPFNPTLLKAEQCKSELREKENPTQEEINACVVPDDKKRMYYSESTFVYTILLKSDLSYPANVLSQLQQMSLAHGGRMIELKRNLSEIPGTMRQIISELAGIRPNLLSCGSPFAVNPYLKRLRVNVYNISDENAIVLAYTDANGQRHEIQKGQAESGFNLGEPYYTYGVNERYVFEYPYPGLWQVTAENCSGVDIYVEAIDFSLEGWQSNLPERIAQRDIEPYYDPNEPHHLIYQMRANNQVIAQAEPNIFKIEAEAIVIAPNGQEKRHVLDYDSAEKQFKTREPLDVRLAGTYTVKIVGQSRKRDGELNVSSTQNLEQVFSKTYTVFGPYEGELQVFPVGPFKLQAVYPAATQQISNVHDTILGGWPLKALPYTVRVQVVDRNGQILPMISEIFTGSDAITVTSQAGTDSFGPVTLTPDAAVLGVFYANLDGVAVEGEQTLTFAIDAEKVREQYRPDERTLTVTFERINTFWHRSGTYLAFFWTIIGLIAIGIVFFVAVRTNPVRGYLKFMDGNLEVAAFALYNGTNTRTISSRELKNYPQIRLKRIEASNVGKPGKASRSEEDVYASSGDGVPLKIRYVTIDGTRQEFQVEPGMAQGYDNETILMLYEPPEG